MVGDYLVEQGQEGDLTPEDKAKILNIVKLTAGSVALVVGVDVNTATNSAGVAVENNSLKIVTTTYKVGKKVFKIATKKGKVTIKDLKKALKEEGFDIADDLITLFDGELTVDDALAVLDLVVGTEFNNRKQKVDMIILKRGVNKNPYTFKELSAIAIKKGYEPKKVSGQILLYNKKGNPKYLIRSNTSHKGDVFKGFNDEKSAINAAKSGRSIENDRIGSYDIHLNKVGK
ncbi:MULTISPECIES: VENN motif pre-toxin domain-containing protein [Pasteurellaceae]|uniref:VENN motif pre-toxin domain-containing protein n=1 Tax=Pasteurella atlantica TaxID=2827233 RepID=A0AAW8CQH1_9PAST|nr:VENN motif pre-toxin domain-containing protein [Pasteurella atlantica]MBR0573019.1 VENN motif pre-toxin domain-containing protein [Pasteurella atlantica]MDP8038854.1 VENN motif pre-toxin domain-containing protein [Pasteurella atlantica]MDP8041037.1 VENN motif pre-toxin domain-containing protein [Pasteurella atlantica]MDP8043173.1 VENN motif pre-toxin domain-containing protein [Pasteurella atlantica]MDP8045259.1 VENN motif pre-toxin domain-containing protein [Pasteurella atlantica]